MLPKLIQNSKIEEAEEWISDLEDRIMENNQAEQERGGKNENRLPLTHDTIKHKKLASQGSYKEN